MILPRTETSAITIDSPFFKVSGHAPGAFDHCSDDFLSWNYCLPHAPIVFYIASAVVLLLLAPAGIGLWYAAKSDKVGEIMNFDPRERELRVLLVAEKKGCLWRPSDKEHLRILSGGKKVQEDEEKV